MWTNLAEFASNYVEVLVIARGGVPDVESRQEGPMHRIHMLRSSIRHVWCWKQADADVRSTIYQKYTSQIYFAQRVHITLLNFRPVQE